MGSPPPTGSKKLVLKLRSVNSMVIPPASTGRDSNNNTVVISTLQTNKGTLLHLIPSVRMFTIVVIKLILPKIEDTPARCRLKIVKSTLTLLWAILDDKGG
jgi:hypothetical protein